MKFQLYTFVFSSVLFFTACNDCHLVDCVPISDFNLKIIELNSGMNLITNTDSTYHTDSIIVSSVDNNSLIMEHSIVRWDNTDSTTIYTILNSEPDMVIVELNSIETDTLFFDYTFIEGECCSNYILDSVAINDGPMVAIQDGEVTIFK